MWVTQSPMHCYLAPRLLCGLTYTNGDLKGMGLMACQDKSDQATIMEYGDCDYNILFTLGTTHGKMGSQFMHRCLLNLFYFTFRKVKGRERKGKEVNGPWLWG